MKIGEIAICLREKDYMVKYCVPLTNKDDKFDVVMFDSSCCFYNIKSEELYHIQDVDKAIKCANNSLDSQIEELRSQLKLVKRSDYTQEIKDKYYALKQQITTTATNMIKAEDEVEFEDKLKAICELKKQMYSIECEGVVEARKFNGNILYKIKQIEKNKKMIEYYLDDRYIRNVLQNVDISSYINNNKEV